MKRKVCIVSTLHSVNDLRVFEKECKSLSKKYEVYYVAPNTETKDIDNIHIVGVSLPDINHRINRWTSLNKIIPILISINAEIYHFQDPELMSVGVKMKKLGKKIIFDSHEDVPAYISTVSYIPKLIRGVVSKCYAVYEKHTLKKYDAVVSVTPFIVNRLRKYNPNTYQITNYPKYKEIEIERKWEKKVCFAGLIGSAWNLDHVINCLPSTGIKLVLCGHFATPDYLNYLKTLPGWSLVDYRGSVSHDKVLEYYGECSAGLAIESFTDPNVGFKEGSLGNTKRLDYMYAGIPLITSASRVWKEVVDENQCGICINDPTDEKEISAALSFIGSHPQEVKEMGDNAGRAVFKKYNWDSQEPILFEMYEKLLSI